MAGLWDTHSHGQQPNSTWHWTLPTARFSQTTFQPSRVALVGWLRIFLWDVVKQNLHHIRLACCNMVYLQKQRSTFFLSYRIISARSILVVAIFFRISAAAVVGKCTMAKSGVWGPNHICYVPYSPTKPALHSFKAKKGTVTERAQNSRVTRF